MFCNNCGTQNPEDGVFCVSCGQSLQAAAQPPQQDYAYQQQAAPPADEAQDAQENKVMGILAYLGPLALVPFFTKKDSPFAMYHTKQGFLLLAVGIAYSVVSFLLGLIKVPRTDIIFGVAVETRSTPWINTLILGLLSLAIGILALVGIFNAIKGLKKPLPLIGNLTFVDKLFTK
jgi:uncharacterized membrane protein